MPLGARKWKRCWVLSEEAEKTQEQPLLECLWGLLTPSSVPWARLLARDSPWSLGRVILTKEMEPLDYSRRERSDSASQGNQGFHVIWGNLGDAIEMGGIRCSVATAGKNPEILVTKSH